MVAHHTSPSLHIDKALRFRSSCCCTSHFRTPLCLGIAGGGSRLLCLRFSLFVITPLILLTLHSLLLGAADFTVVVAGSWVVAGYLNNLQAQRRQCSVEGRLPGEKPDRGWLLRCKVVQRCMVDVLDGIW